MTFSFLHLIYLIFGHESNGPKFGVSMNKPKNAAFKDIVIVHVY